MKKKEFILACEIFFREICYLVSKSRKVFDVQFLPKALHDLGGDKMRKILQEEIDRLDETGYERILLAYALCNNGITGLKARSIPIIIPKAHDCITVFLGSRSKYKEYFFNNPGTYFHTLGWIERGGIETRQIGLNQPGDVLLTLKDYIDKYGDENGKYLWDMLNPEKNYKRIAYINIDVQEMPDYREFSKKTADEKGWQWEEIKGNLNILEKIIDGIYDDDFLVLEPGMEVVATNDEQIITGKVVDSSGRDCSA